MPPDTEWAEDETRKERGDPDNPMQGAKVFFKYPDYYIHGTNAPGTLGTAASHGCLRMNEVDIENLAEFIQKAGGEDRGDSWFERVRAPETDLTEVSFPIRSRSPSGSERSRTNHHPNEEVAHGRDRHRTKARSRVALVAAGADRADPARLDAAGRGR